MEKYKYRLQTFWENKTPHEQKHHIKGEQWPSAAAAPCELPQHGKNISLDLCVLSCSSKRHNSDSYPVSLPVLERWGSSPHTSRIWNANGHSAFALGMQLSCLHLQEERNSWSGPSPQVWFTMKKWLCKLKTCEFETGVCEFFASCSKQEGDTNSKDGWPKGF